MTARVCAIGFATTLTVWFVCLYLVAAWHAEVSQSTVGMNVWVIATTITSLMWPFFAVRLLGKGVYQAWKRLRR